MNVFGVLAVIFLLAFLVESLVEAVLGTPFDKIPKLTPYKWLLMYAALIVGVIGSFVYRFDLLHLLSAYLDELLPNSNFPVIPVTDFGTFLTGLAIGRGSNYLHDLVGKWFKPVAPPEKQP